MIRKKTPLEIECNGREFSPSVERLPVSDKVIVGIRPEDIPVSSAQTGTGIEGTVMITEPAGSSTGSILTGTERPSGDTHRQIQSCRPEKGRGWSGLPTGFSSSMLTPKNACSILTYIIHKFSDECGGYIRDIMQKTQKIPLAAYVLSSEDMEFRKLFSSLEAS
ncbi:MAG: hypothetical protein L6290_05985 [Thermodesulfovibrionales bacterium]|nr:hypothetical protein [Thermodesulfovibrionales bacterium]